MADTTKKSAKKADSPNKPKGSTGSPEVEEEYELMPHKDIVELREELKKLKKEADKRREEICVCAEELSESTEWRKTAEELKRMQAEWKSLIKGRRHDEEKLYRRFRKACTHFFDNRHKNYEGQEEKRRENLTRKEELCKEAEALAETAENIGAELEELGD